MAIKHWYSLKRFIYFKQGHDFYECLKECQGNVYEALNLWIAGLKHSLDGMRQFKELIIEKIEGYRKAIEEIQEGIEYLEELVEAIKNENITAKVETYGSEFTPIIWFKDNEEILNRLTERGLITKI